MEQAGEGREFSYIAPAGYYIALRVGFAFPIAETNALPDAWIERYTQRGYMLFDPVMQWLYGNSGAIRWSEIGLPDPMGILTEAAAHGLVHGADGSARLDLADRRIIVRNRAILHFDLSLA